MDRKTRRMLGAMSLLPTAVAAWGQSNVAASPVAPSVPLAGQETKTWTFHHEQVLGTSLRLTVRATDRAAAIRAETAALGVFDRQEAILSAWQPHSEFSRWAATRFQAVPVSEELLSTLSAFDGWRERTDGALDASVEAATRLWQRSTADGHVPTDAEIAQTAEAIAQPHWCLDLVHHTATRLSDVPLALASFTKSRITSQAADAALAAGASGVLLNVGGDIVARGAITQIVGISDPRHSAENDPALDYVAITNRAVATSGGYRRGFDLAASPVLQSPTLRSPTPGAPAFSHLIDPRTARPVGHILSSTVLAHDAETAGALATAFSVLSSEESQRLAASTPGVEYLILAADGERLTSPGWANYQIPGAASASFVRASLPLQAKSAMGLWNGDFELDIRFSLPRVDDARYRRPYVAVWIEDADHFPVRTLSLWTQNPRWLPELKQWYRDDRVRSLSEGSDISRTISSATRPPGEYSLKWDGKDNQGKLVKAGTYTVVIEASREHGGYQIERKSITFSGQPGQATLPAGQELGTIQLDYRKR